MRQVSHDEDIEEPLLPAVQNPLMLPAPSEERTDEKQERGETSG
jgi:hypothetical protein